MKYLASLLILFILNSISSGQANDHKNELEKRNLQIATAFYEDLWFTNNTDKYEKYVADSYIVHDIGDRKGVREEAIEQKEIADFFWRNGDLLCEMDFQIADGDLVASRWIVGFKPKTLVGKLLIGEKPLPIINVFRIKDGKIVEIWNHRHDIDTRRTLVFTMKGLLLGLILVGFCMIWVFRLKRKIKELKMASAS